MAKMKLRLSPDYFCSPLWLDDYSDPDADPEVNPEDLPVSAKLGGDLWSWAREFDAILNENDPSRSEFPSAEAEIQFKKRGLELAQRLRVELAGVATIRYKYESELE
jgi:hypothetical protein